MSYNIKLRNAPGILALFQFSPGLAIHLNSLAQHLLRGPSPLEPWEREFIAAFVSRGNGTEFCFQSHLHVAAELAKVPTDRLVRIMEGRDIDVSPMLLAAMNIAEEVRISGKTISQRTLELARENGLEDAHIHDIVAITAAFCMYNRYVDGLGTKQPAGGKADYEHMGKHLAQHGYGILPGTPPHPIPVADDSPAQQPSG